MRDRSYRRSKKYLDNTKVKRKEQKKEENSYRYCYCIRCDPENIDKDIYSKMALQDYYDELSGTEEFMNDPEFENMWTLFVLDEWVEKWDYITIL